MSKWAICNIFISILSVINISLEVREVFTKTKLMAMFILETYHQKEEESFRKACEEFYSTSLKPPPFDKSGKLIRRGNSLEAENLQVHS